MPAFASGTFGQGVLIGGVNDPHRADNRADPAPGAEILVNKYRGHGYLPHVLILVIRSSAFSLFCGKSGACSIIFRSRAMFCPSVLCPGNTFLVLHRHRRYPARSRCRAGPGQPSRCARKKWSIESSVCDWHRHAARRRRRFPTLFRKRPPVGKRDETGPVDQRLHLGRDIEEIDRGAEDNPVRLSHLPDTVIHEVIIEDTRRSRFSKHFMQAVQPWIFFPPSWTVSVSIPSFSSS